MSKINKLKFVKGFTIIETLVAITILMIAIAGPLTIASKGLNAAIYGRDQVMATYLAQDAMEYIKNLRDFNVLNSGTESGPNEWLARLDQCTAGDPCGVETLNLTFETSGYDGDNGILFNATSYRLYITNAGYSNNGTVPSQFTRKFWLSPAPHNSYERIATVEVGWNNGKIQNVVTVKNNIFKIVR